MVGSGNVKRAGVQAPPPLGQHSIRAAGVAAPSMGGHQTTTGTGNQTSPKIPSLSNHSSEVLGQTRKVPHSPAKLAIGGFGIALTLAYFTLYTKKKPEATALDVARVATGTSTPANTRPRD